MLYSGETMGIKDAIRSVPAKPGIALAFIATIIFGGWHYYTEWRACENRAKAAAKLRSAIAVSKNNGETIDLAQIFSFPWEEVIVIADPSPSRNTLSCSFRFMGGSHWSLTERVEMAQEGRLAVLSFYHQGRSVAYIEYLKEWGDFQTGNKPVPREQARFHHFSTTQLGDSPRLELVHQPE